MHPFLSQLCANFLVRRAFHKGFSRHDHTIHGLTKDILQLLESQHAEEVTIQHNQINFSLGAGSHRKWPSLTSVCSGTVILYESDEKIYVEIETCSRMTVEALVALVVLVAALASNPLLWTVLGIGAAVVMLGYIFKVNTLHDYSWKFLNGLAGM